MSQMNPCQSRVPLQTNPNNFQTSQQTNNQQSTQCSNYPGNSQGQYMQGPFGQFYQQENYPSAQYPCTTQLPNNTTNLCQGIPCQNTMSPMQAQANNNCGSLPQNIIDQIRSCITNTAPIFIIPGGCQQPLVTTTQQATTIPDILNPLASSNKQSNYIPTPLTPPIYPPTFYPYPIPFPIFDPYGLRSNEQQKNHCGCSSKSNGESTGSRQFPALLPYPHNVYHEEEHRCTNTTDDTICTKRNCPSAISLQALASQLLSIQGIVSCTATRLLLRKIPGSNITTTMEDTMERAQRSIGALNKDQLLVESRNSQQVNALINLHMTANPPANVIPILTLVQLKVNVLKAQVENLINARLMENQGLEIETTDSIDPTILAMKTDAELREFLVILRQKECDERVNLNFAPYRSQRVIAESRLSNVQKKVQQVEAEFERRRCNVAPSIPPMSTRVVREFAETPINFSSHNDYYYHPNPTSPGTITRESPDPFAITPKSPRKLRLKPHVGSPETTYDYSIKKKDPMGTPYKNDKGSQMETETKGRKRNDRCDHKNCDCYDESSSGESSEEEKKKKLQLRIDERGNVTVSSEAKLNGASFMKLASNVSLRTAKPKSDAFDRRDRKVKPSRTEIKDIDDFRESTSPRRTVSKVEEEITEVTETDGRITVDGSVDRAPDVKPYGTVDGEKKRESIESAELTSKEFKDEPGAYGDAKGETYVSVSDVNLTDEEKMMKKIVNSSRVKEFTPSHDKEVQIPESMFDKTSVSIDKGVIEVDKIKSDALTEESRMKISTSDSEEKLYDVKGEKIDDSAKSETTEAERMMRVESPKRTFVTTASMKIEPTKIDEERTDVRHTAGSSKVTDELFYKPKKTFLTSLKIGNSLKPEIKDEKEMTIEVGSPKKTFVSTASMKIEPSKIDEEYIDEPALRSLKISDVLPDKPKKTFLTTLKIGNSVKPKIKEETKGTIEVGSPKKTFVSTASIRIDPPKIDEGHIDEPMAGSSKVADERSEKPKKTFVSTARIKIEPSKIDEELPDKPKKTFLTTLKIGNSVKPEIKDEAEGTIEVGSPKKTFVSTASIKIEPPNIDVEHIDEPTAGTSKISDERSGKPKQTFLSTASIKIEPPKIDEGHIEEPTAGSSKIADERSGKPKKTFLSTARIKVEPSKIDEELSDKPKKTFLTTLKIGNSVKPEIKDETKGRIEVGSPKKTFVSTASVRIEPPKIDEEHNVEPTVGISKISDELSVKPRKTYLTTLKIGNPIKPEVKDENEKTIETGDFKKTYVAKAFLKIEPEDDEERQPKTKMFKSDPMKLRINPKDREGTDEQNPEKSAGTSTIATISIGKKEGDDDDDDDDDDDNDDVIGKKEKSDIGTNEKIVSVLTEIKYDEPEAIAELFRSAFTRNFQLDKDIAERSCESKYESSDTGNYYTMALSFSENRLPWRIDIKKQENGIERLNNRSRDASENTYNPEETRRKLNACKYKNDTTRFPFVNSDYDTSDSHVDNDRGVLSEIISSMYNQLLYFGGAINKFPLFDNNIRSRFDGSVPEKINSGSNDRRYYSTSRRPREDFEKFWKDPCKEYHAIFEDVRRLDDDEIENQDDGFVLYDSMRSIERSDKNVTGRVIGNNGSSRVVATRKYDNKEIRDRLRYMIVEDRYNKKCYLMPEFVTTFRGHDSRKYAKPNLITRPYKIRRNLLIRSRLKDDRNAFEQNPLPPFTIVKRTGVGNWKSFCYTTNCGERWRGRRTFSRLRYANKKGEKFYSLPLIRGKNSKISSTLEKSSTSKAIPSESDTKTTVTFFSNDSCVSTDATGSSIETRHY